MTKTSSNDTPPPMGARVDCENTPRIEGELEVVLKFRGVYCFARRRKPAGVEFPSAVMAADEERGLMPIDS